MKKNLLLFVIALSGSALGMYGCGSNADTSNAATAGQTAAPPQLPPGSTPQNESGAANPEAGSGT